MSDDASRPLDVKAVWQGQPREIEPMVLAQVRTEAVRFQRRRRNVMIREVLAAIFVMVVFGLYIRFLPGPFLKAGSALGIVWAVGYIWKWVRVFRPRRVPDDAAACLDFHRREMERQRDGARSIGRWGLAYLLPVMVLFVIGRWLGPTPPWRGQGLDHLIIIVTGVFLIESLALVWLWTQHRADHWQDRIDELDALGSKAP
jgi:hypothetical protein